MPVKTCVMCQRCSMTVALILILVLLGFISPCFCFDFPSGLNSDIPSVSTISASSRCSTSDGSCNTTCPTRSSTPSFLQVFVNIHMECDKTLPVSPDKPNHVQADNGLMFTNDTVRCTSHNVTNTMSSGFTLSLWFYATCSDCTILSLGPNVLIRYANDRVTMGSEGGTVNKFSWTHLALRFDGKLTWFLNDTTYTSSETSLSDTISFGPNADLVDEEVVAFLDAKIYQIPLTAREIQSIRTGTLMNLPVETECRCPDNAPFLVEDTVPQKYLKCKNSDATTTVSRLNRGDHRAIFMIDKDENTYWKSGRETDVTLTLILPELYQLQSLTLSGLETIPVRLTITLKHGAEVKSTITIQESCSDDTCISYSTNIQTSKKLSYDFENGVTLSTKTDVDAIVADVVEIKFESHSLTYFQVSELELGVRCHCYGNDKTCSISGTSYTCACTSHTTGTHCGECVDEYFVTDQRYLTCMNSCNCATRGSNNNNCNKIGGQCSCKNNTEGRTCDQCKHNTINLGSDINEGCKTCTCTAEGIERCESDGTCVCKPNVETTSTRCMACKDNYYGIGNSGGCKSCACDVKGTKQNIYCDKVTGQCSCKTYVEGRTCNTCIDEYFQLTNANPNGCQDCECNFIGSVDGVCNKVTGQCPCLRGNITDRQCNPVIKSIVPLYGPMAGGTQITITGQLLWKAGVNFTFSINDTTQYILMKNDSVIIVETKPSLSIHDEKTTIAWYKGTLDHRVGNLPYQTFRYKTNPSITVSSTIFYTYASGGCRVEIAGEHFDSIYQPELTVYDESKLQSISSVCSRMSNQQILCPMPNVTSFTTSGNLSYGFRLDNVDGFRDLSSRGTFIQVHPDPVINDNQVVEYKNTFDKEIKITGNNLNLACDYSGDVRINIGENFCHIKERTNTHIICDPKDEFPGSDREEDLVVYVGNIAVRQGVVKFKGFWTLPEVIAIIVSVVIVIVIIIVVVVYCFVLKRRISGPTEYINGVEMREEKHEVTKPRENSYDKWPNALSNLNAPKLPADTATTKDPVAEFIDRLDPSVGKDVRSSLIDRARIEPRQICKNKGSKIRVINGQLTGSPKKELTIKTLVSSYSETGALPSWLNDGLKESMRLQNCANDNVLRMMGISVDNKNVYVLYPEMSNRTLKEYLTSAKQAFNNDLKLDLCVQALEGMVYLSSENIVHRDLAARNCWVSADGIVKIADASFSYDLYPEEYLTQNGRHQPVRWMAPESLRQLGFYTTKTDIWSFGVLVWEVMTNGYLPYQDVTKSSQIKDYVCEQGYKLGSPHDCPDNVYSVIEHCQGDYAEQRPSFPELLQTFTNIISPDSGAGDHMYQNQSQLQANQNPDEHDMEIYENAAIKPPPRMPKPKR